LLDKYIIGKVGETLIPLQPPRTLAVALKLVTVKLPEKLIDDVDQLVKAGIYHSRSDAIRAAVRDLLRRELWQPGQA
jgi:antitoxin ParD1/3/4